MIAKALPHLSDSAKATSYMDQFNIENEHELLNSMTTILSSAEHNLHRFLEDIPQIFGTNYLERGFNEEKTNGENTCIPKIFLNNLSTSSIAASKDNVEEVATLKSKCEDLQIKVEYLTKERETAFEKIKHLEDQILNQSTYCASLGAVLGNLTWCASKFPQIVDAWLSTFQNKIDELLSIIDASFGAFVNTYKNAFPPTTNVEYQFVLGLLGIVTNISASPEGREFLITNSNGKEFVYKTIKLMPELPLTSGSSSLKRLMLMILYNVSMNKTGLQHLLDSQIGDTLNHCLENKSSSEEIYLLCLRVLQSITYDLTEPKYIQDLTTSVPIGSIEVMTFSKQSDISDLAKQIVKHFRDCRKFTK